MILRLVPVYVTPLMFKRTIENVISDKSIKMYNSWESLQAISKNMTIAAVASEDNLFVKHHGFSIDGIQQAIKERNSGKRIRGGSTISQQTAKNVFTLGTRSWFRKGVESYYTLLIELIWGKERIMEVYLNVVELGNNIYGVKSASLCYFHKNASQLSRSECALLAAALPNPRVYSVVSPGPYMRKRELQILNLMPKMGKIPFLNNE